MTTYNWQCARIQNGRRIGYIEKKTIQIAESFPSTSSTRRFHMSEWKCLS